MDWKNTEQLPDFTAGEAMCRVMIRDPQRLDAIDSEGCRLLAEAVARQLSLPCRQLLARRDDHAKSQVSLSGTGRKANLKGVFEPLEEISFPVLLVDDVRTTGTTLARCAEALRDGGAQQVTAITVTRAHDGK